jgi:hypothetical protein
MKNASHFGVLHEIQPPVRSTRRCRHFRGAALGTSVPVPAAKGVSPDAELETCLVSVRRHQISGRLQTFRLRQSERATGGTVRQSAFGTFDNFNVVIAGVKGNVAIGTELFTEALMTPALDRYRPNTACWPKQCGSRKIIRL